MCGIAGMFRFDGRTVTSDQVSPMIEAMHHRGPDGTGFHMDGPIALGFTRLAIIDVAGGQQPIFNEDESMAIICNGEIYNYPKLREGLVARGHIFRTHSDVEVVLHLYEEKGEACFAELNGMFGIAIADFEKKRMIIARDACGQKPLYYWHTPEALVFASELHGLLEAPGLKPELSDEALRSYLAFGYVSSPLSAVKQVKKLTPGSYAAIENDGCLEVTRYWSIDLGPKPGSAASKADDIQRKLMESVERHLMSERPLGVFLSGGLDSASIVACMHMNGHRDIRTFTIGCEGYLDNEFENARRVAEKFKTSHTEILVSPEDYWNSIERVASMQEDPIADRASILFESLCREAAKEVVVVLSGEGSDEMLGGYNGTEMLRRIFDRLHRLRRVRTLFELAHALAPDGPVRNRLKSVLMSDSEYMAKKAYEFEGYFDFVFGQKHHLEQLQSTDPFKPLANFYRERPAWEGVELRMGGLVEWWLPDDLLQRADRLGMAHSIEIRCPFLDTEFIAYCVNLPLDEKVRAVNEEPVRKIALKRAFDRVLPDGIAMQRKKGFANPIFEWMSTVYRERVTQELTREDSLSARFLPAGVRTQILKNALSGERLSQERLWFLFFLNIWGSQWAERSANSKVTIHTA